MPEDPGDAQKQRKPWQFQPGNEYAFKKGQSGNPGGVPKGRKSLKRVLEEALDMTSAQLERKINEATTTMRERVIYAEVLDGVQRDSKASGGARTRIWDRVDGPVTQQIDVGEGIPIRRTILARPEDVPALQPPPPEDDD